MQHPTSILDGSPPEFTQTASLSGERIPERETANSGAQSPKSNKSTDVHIDPGSAAADSGSVVSIVLIHGRKSSQDSLGHPNGLSEHSSPPKGTTGGCNHSDVVSGVQPLWLEPLAKELDRREVYAGSNNAVAETLEASGFASDAEKLAGCGSHMLFRAFDVTGNVRLRECDFCSLTRACPACARIKAARTADVYTAKALALLDSAYDAGEALPLPSLVTVTVKAGPDLRTQFQAICDGVQKVSRLRRNCRHRNQLAAWAVPSHFAWSVEVKRSKNDPNVWHCHAHSVCLSPQKLNLDGLQREWHSMTGATVRPDVRLMTSGRAMLGSRGLLHNDKVRQQLRMDLKEVFKYSLKFGELSPVDVAEVYVTTKRKRMLFGCDGFRGCKVPDALEDMTDELGSFMDFHFGRKIGQTKARLIRSRSGEGEQAGEWCYEKGFSE